MRALNRLCSGFAALFRRRQIEQDLDDELTAFLEAAIETKVAEGLSRADAERAARLELGSPAAVKDWVRDAGWESRIESIWQDVRYALRTLRRSPGFALTAIGTLAVGLGTTAGMYAVVDAVLLKPFPFDAPDRVFSLRYQDETGGSYGVGAGAIAAVRQLPAVEYAAGVLSTERAIVAGDLSLLASGEAVTEEFFQVFGVPAAFGRTFSAADRDSGPVVLLSDRFWRRAFGAQRDIIGGSLLMSGISHQVLGVMPREFHTGPALPPDFWVLRPFEPTEAARTGDGPFQAFSRLGPGDTRIASAQIETMNLPPVRVPASGGGALTLSLIPIADTVAVFYGHILWSLLGAASIVLLLASGNVANLLLARGRQRAPELLVRAAIGASRGRLLRQVITESAVLAAIAGAAGCTLAWLIVKALPLLPLTTANVTRIDEVALNGRVSAFTIALTLATVLLFGALPALAIARQAAVTGSARSVTRRHRRTAQVLIAIEIAATVALLAGSGLVALRISNLLGADFGFELRGLYMASFRPLGTEYRDENLTRLYTSVMERLRDRSGIEAALIDRVPLDFWLAPPVRLRIGDADQPALSARIRTMSPGALPLIGATIRSGRDFTAADRAGSPAVAVVNGLLAARLVERSASPIGSRITVMQGDQRHVVRVIGVTNDLRDSIYRSPGPEIFVSTAQFPPSRAAFVVRSDRSPEELTRALREALREVDSRQALSDAVPLSDRVRTYTALSRFAGIVVGTFAVLAVLLASTGVVAVAAASVASRTREIGIRVAIGATRADVLASLSRDLVPGVLFGAIVGIGTAALLTNVLRWLTPGTASFHPLAYGGAVAVGVLTVACGAWLPARRALAIQPTIALNAPEEW